MEKEWKWIKLGNLLLFSTNLGEDTWNKMEDISADIQFVSDESFFTKEKLGKGSYLNTEILKDRFDKKDIFCTATFNGEIVSYCWIASHEVHVGEIGKTIQLKKDEIYLYDAFTKPDFRGKYLFPKILASVLSYGKEKGHQRALIFALSSNRASVSAIKKVGFHQFQNVCFFDMFFKTLCIFSRVRDGELGIEERF